MDKNNDDFTHKFLQVIFERLGNEKINEKQNE